MPERVIILEFKDRLKHLRKEKNLTQIELASILLLQTMKMAETNLE